MAEPPIVATGPGKGRGDELGDDRQGARTTARSPTSTRPGSSSTTTSRIKLRKYVGLNERTCLNQKPVVDVGQKVKKGDILADGASTYKGELALGRNVLVGFMAWDGYNFEDAIIISERLVKEDVYTSIHIEEFEIEIRETKLGREEFTRDIPNVSEKALRNLDENGIVRIGTYVKPGDILVGKVAPKSKSELTPEEKLLHAIFGRAGEDVKNDSLEVPSGVEGIVINTQRFSRRMSLNEDERKAFEKELKDTEAAENVKIADEYKQMIKALEEAVGGPVLDPSTGKPLGRDKDPKALADEAERFRLEALDLRSPEKSEAARKVVRSYGPRIEALRDEKDRKLNSLKRGDELPSGVLQMVKIYIATKRVISVGDKMAGRHGNKGVIAKILPEEDMPFLADGTAVEILLNPLGVPSRMNVGQILETHLGWAASKLGFQAVCPVFDGADESTIRECLVDAGLPENGKAQLYDGRTGEQFDQRVTVGYIYMLKLHHLVDDKIHARATGPYSPDHPAAAGRQGPVRRPAVRRDGSLGAGGLRRRVHLAGTPHRQERRRRGPHQDLREHGQGREHPRSRHPRQLRRLDQRDPRPRAQHAARKEADLSADDSQPPALIPTMGQGRGLLPPAVLQPETLHVESRHAFSRGTERARPLLPGGRTPRHGIAARPLRRPELSAPRLRSADGVDRLQARTPRRPRGDLQTSGPRLVGRDGVRRPLPALSTVGPRSPR